MVDFAERDICLANDHVSDLEPSTIPEFPDAPKTSANIEGNETVDNFQSYSRICDTVTSAEELEEKHWLVETSREEITRLELNCKAVEEERMRLRESNMGLKSRLLELKNTCSHYQSCLEEKCNLVKQKDAELKNRGKEIEDLRTILEDRILEEIKTNRLLDIQEIEGSTKLAEKDEVISEQRNAMSILQLENKQLRDELNRINEKFHCTCLEMAEKDKKFEATILEVERLEVNNQELTDKINKIKEKSDDLMISLDALEAGLTAKESEVSFLEGRNESVEKNCYEIISRKDKELRKCEELLKETELAFSLAIEQNQLLKQRCFDQKARMIAIDNAIDVFILSGHKADTANPNLKNLFLCIEKQQKDLFDLQNELEKRETEIMQNDENNVNISTQLNALYLNEMKQEDNAAECKKTKKVSSINEPKERNIKGACCYILSSKSENYDFSAVEESCFTFDGADTLAETIEHCYNTSTSSLETNFKLRSQNFPHFKGKDKPQNVSGFSSELDYCIHNTEFKAGCIDTLSVRVKSGSVEKECKHFTKDNSDSRMNSDYLDVNGPRHSDLFNMETYGKDYESQTAEMSFAKEAFIPGSAHLTNRSAAEEACDPADQSQVYVITFSPEDHSKSSIARMQSSIGKEQVLEHPRLKTVSIINSEFPIIGNSEKFWPVSESKDEVQLLSVSFEEEDDDNDAQYSQTEDSDSSESDTQSVGYVEERGIVDDDSSSTDSSSDDGVAQSYTLTVNSNSFDHENEKSGSESSDSDNIPEDTEEQEITIKKVNLSLEECSNDDAESWVEVELVKASPDLTFTALMDEESMIEKGHESDVCEEKNDSDSHESSDESSVESEDSDDSSKEHDNEKYISISPTNHAEFQPVAIHSDTDSSDEEMVHIPESVEPVYVEMRVKDPYLSEKELTEKFNPEEIASEHSNEHSASEDDECKEVASYFPECSINDDERLPTFISVKENNEQEIEPENKTLKEYGMPGENYKLINDLRQENSDLKSEIEQITAKNIILQEDVNDLKKTITLRDDAIKATKSRENYLVKANEDSRIEIGKLEADLAREIEAARRCRQCEHLRETVARERNEIERLKKELSEANLKLETSGQELLDLKKNIAEAQYIPMVEPIENNNKQKKKKKSKSSSLLCGL